MVCRLTYSHVAAIGNPKIRVLVGLQSSQIACTPMMNPALFENPGAQSRPPYLVTLPQQKGPPEYASRPVFQP
jgi:hypothetical protein